MNLLSTTSVFSFFTLISRILGYLRDILIAIFLGTSILADAFFVAFRLPNTFRRLFAEGTFNAAFIPSYTNEKIKSKKSGNGFADDVFSLLVIVLFFLVLLVEIFTPYVVYLIAPGFYTNLEKYELAIQLTRITFPFLFFVSLSSFFSGILNSNNKFAAAAAAPIILNVVLILSLYISYFYNLSYVQNLSYGVTFAGIIQLIFLIYFTKKFYKPSLNFKLKINAKVKFFLKKLLPSIFSSGVTQINILIGTIIASFEAGAVSYLYYADRVYQINLAIAGIAVGTVSLPALSKAIKKKRFKTADKIQNQSLELSLLLSVPAAFGLIIASEEIINVLFGYGSFSQNDIIMTSKALKYFGFGVPAFALIKVLSNLFFARDNTKTPLYISFLIVLFNVSLSIVFFRQIGFIIIPIATSISTWIGVIVYYILLNRKKYIIVDFLLIKNILKIVVSTISMSVILFFSLNYFQESMEYYNNYKSIYLLIIIGFVSTIYLLLCYFLGVLKTKNYKTN